MIKKLFKVTGLIVVAAIVAIMSLWPIAVSADLTTDCVFHGYVTLDGKRVPAGTTVTGWIDGVGQWSTGVYGVSEYDLMIPAASGSKMGGVEGDIVHIKVTVNGTDIPGISGVFKYENNVYLDQVLITAVNPVIITTWLPEVTVGAAGSSVTLTAAGGTPPYIWSGTGWPAGGFNLAANGVISGTPTTAGNYNVGVTVADSASPAKTDTKYFTLKINPSPTPLPLSITTSALDAGNVGVFYDFTMTATGGTGAYAWSGTGLPAGLGIAASTGLISGTTTVSGNFSVAITVVDSAVPAGTATRNYSLIIAITPSPLTITTTALDAGNVGASYDFTVAASGGTGAYTWNSTGLPAGLGIGASTGLISGTTMVSGNYSVAITVVDSAVPADTDTRNYFLIISSIPSPLTITTVELTRWSVEIFPVSPPVSWLPLPAPGWIINQVYSATLTATGGTGALTWSASNLPTGLSISAAGVISGIPSAEGLFDITFNVQDSASTPITTNKTLQLKVYLVGDANGNGTVSIADVTYAERCILGLSAPTAGCDANVSNSISIADVTKIERIILGLP